MIRKIAFVVLTVAAAAVVVGGILGSAFGKQGGVKVWIIDEQRIIWTRVSIPVLSGHYFTTNVPEQPTRGRSWLGSGFARYPTYRRSDGVYSRTVYTVFCPTWLATILLGFYPALAFVKRRRSPRSGHCHRCSYDLTGNVSGLCPECGTRIESS